MRVRVEMTVEIDDHAYREAEQVWTLTPAELRANVRGYVETLVEGYMAERGLLVVEYDGPAAPEAQDPTIRPTAWAVTQ